jgi:hypothetical protein
MKIALGLLAISVAMAACGQGAGAEGGRIEGRVLAGPQCPVVRVDDPCPDRPVAAHLEIADAGSGEIVAKAETGDDGRFSVSVDSGSYEVTATATTGLPNPASAEVRVRGDADVHVELHVDTGIR